MNKPRKYNEKKIVVDGYQFDSNDEFRYYEYLLEKKAKGEIINFELKPKFEVFPSFRKGGKLHRAITYTPDFCIYQNGGSVLYVDVKGFGTVTQPSEMRRKMWDYKYPDLNMEWICRNLKHSPDGSGWIRYEDLKKIRAKEKKKKLEGIKNE